MILILSDKFDSHAELVCRKLDEKKANYFRFNLDKESLEKTKITFIKDEWEIRQDNKMITSSCIKKVWVRRPFVELSLEEQNINSPGFKIWKGEWNKTLLGLYNSIKKAKWLNPLAKAYQVENKYLQRDLAKKHGFKIPEMIVSNKKEVLLDFAKKHKEVVLKLMNQEFYQDENGEFKGLYVNKLTEHDLKKFNETGENPIVLQPYIDKEYEVRYTIVGKDHHVCRIDSQKSKISNVDWRRYDIPNTPHLPINPPESIKKKVERFMEDCGIYFGAFDFIVTPQGEWYFLEINTMGQWRWIEDLTGLKISDSIVNFLTSQKE